MRNASRFFLFLWLSLALATASCGKRGPLELAEDVEKRKNDKKETLNQEKKEDRKKKDHKNESFFLDFLL